MKSLTRCLNCRARLELQARGRPKLYCGGACRVAAHRRRRLEAELFPSTIHEAAGTEQANRAHSAV